ncbi:diguanylate cyclase [Paralcaligenes sp. KSB-10]|uniref:diguanylate cyclase n=1 Tax=Paralcaligenes sp. KSB-10 TaxID=2901142 RepID=UPI001E4C5FAA|nr:diguanylate cyclase [Paralcaligenes sp. KSB-10]UHL63349.1 diguanylate cyclase [Paralcaligenes sp. KSB-10]
MSELTHCANHGGTFALVMFDIDRFKAINDEFGHGAGDQALKALAAYAARTFRDIDSLGRWGGDEFVALARNVDVVAAKAGPRQ